LPFKTKCNHEGAKAAKTSTKEGIGEGNPSPLWLYFVSS